jgi:hypothetical protein
MDDLKERLRKQARCIYIAVEGTVADDIADGTTQALARIEALEQRVSELEEALTRISMMSDAEHPQREARRALMTSEWRPIETAPKDGSEFDAWAVWLDTGKGERGGKLCSYLAR